MVAPDICIYHSPCQDGFGAAYAVWKKYGDSVEYFPTTYYVDPPDVTGKVVVMCDFSYKADVLREILRKAAFVYILDHHATAIEEVQKLTGEYDPNRKVVRISGDYTETAPNLHVELDIERSGAVITWQFYHQEPVPKLLRHIGDRDLWKFEIEGTREISSALFARDYTFVDFHCLALQAENILGWMDIYNEGAAINRKHDKDIKELLGLTKREMTIAGVKMPVANMPYTMASDAANLMAKEADGVAATYFDTPQGRKFSLRSTGLDVTVLAKKYGGGGHTKASGFTVPLGWEGE